MKGRFNTSRNFLATDRVPETIFGIPVVSRPEQYTEKDIAFFKEYPEAGGYYDLGDGAEESQGDQDGGDSKDFGKTTHAERTAAAVAEVIPFIKEHEKFRPEAYKDSVGRWTIGYGQTTINGREVRKGDKISEKDAAAFVEKRVRDNVAKLDAQNAWTQNLSVGALAALYDVAYNAGHGVFSEEKSPNLNATMSDADMDFDAILWHELPTYVHAGGQRVQGLVNRRNDAINKWREQ